MISREQAKQILLSSLENDGHKWDDIVLSSPRKGKNSWTKREMYDAIMNDCSVEDMNYNPIDSYLHYLKWKEERDSKTNVNTEV